MSSAGALASAAAAAGASAPEKQLPVPAPILQLPEAVVHRIAAGEVIQRPASALKEMLENSIDAGATRISVTIKEGGLRLLQVADDGCGVQRGDLPLLCVRHATSKLRAYEDLETISTLGFRGEALASISFVAHLSVTTMTRGAAHGWRASYQDGALLDPPGPKPCAAVPGTVLTVEDLFFNVPARRKAFRAGGAEEGALVLDLLQRYAVWAAPRVGFSLRRQGEARADLATTPGVTRVDVIRQMHGPELAAVLLPLSLSRGRDPGPDLAHDAPDGPHLRGEGFVTGLHWTGRRGALVLFINGRCVECGPLKRGAEAVYASLVPRAPKPWMFLDVRLPPRQVEVNVHPTKREVGFLHQDEVIDAICRELEATLLAAMSSRTFNKQGTATGAAASLNLAEQLAKGASQQQRQSSAQKGQQQPQTQQQSAPPVYRPDKLVRADHRMRTMDAFVVRGPAAATAGTSDGNAAALPQQPPQLQQPEQCEVAAAAGAAPINRPSAQGAAAAGERQEYGASNAALAAVAGGVPRKRRASERDRLAFNSTIVAAAAAAEQQQERGQMQEWVDDGCEMQDQRPPAPGSAGAAGAIGNGRPQLPGNQRQQASSMVRQRSNPPGPPPVAAARDLLSSREASSHSGLCALIRQHVFVGLADEAGEWALLQHGTRLYLVACGPLSRDLFEQQLLRRWGRCDAVALGVPGPGQDGQPAGLRVSDLALVGLELEAEAGRWKPSDGPIPELARLTSCVLAQHSSLLAQAGLVVEGDAEGARLVALPQLLDGYSPDASRLPELVLALVRDVKWESGDEREVLGGVAAAVAAFFALMPLPPEPSAGHHGDGNGVGKGRVSGCGVGGAGAAEDVAGAAAAAAAAAAAREGGTCGDAQAMEVDVHDRDDKAADKRQGGMEVDVDPGAGDMANVQKHTDSGVCATPPAAPFPAALAAHRHQSEREWLSRHVVFPAIKSLLVPQACRVRDGSCLLLTSMERLYRVFERCG